MCVMITKCGEKSVDIVCGCSIWFREFQMRGFELFIVSPFFLFGRFWMEIPLFEYTMDWFLDLYSTCFFKVYLHMVWIILNIPFNWVFVWSYGML